MKEYYVRGTNRKVQMGETLKFRTRYTTKEGKAVDKSVFCDVCPETLPYLLIQNWVELRETPAPKKEEATTKAQEERQNVELESLIEGYCKLKQELEEANNKIFGLSKQVLSLQNRLEELQDIVEGGE